MAHTSPDRRFPARLLALGLGMTLVAGCESGWDYDFRNLGNNPEPPRVEAAPRPEPDQRGVISYPTYQVAVARRGDRLSDVAARVGLPAAELASYNGISADATLNNGEVIALPRRVADAGGVAAAPLGNGTITPAGAAPGQVDIATLAGNALDRAGGTAPAAGRPAGQEPIRHKVVRGETAYSIARLYNVTPRSLADWNGLGPDLTVREGQYLLIPVAAQQARPSGAAAAGTAVAAVPTTTERPGQGSALATPPSAATPLPKPEPAAKPAVPASPEMAKDQSTASARFAMPVSGSIIRGYQKGKNDGIDISAKAGTAVKAVADGTVAAITRDTDQVPILVVRHSDNMLSVYANIDGIAVQKGAKVTRGQTVAQVRSGNPAFLHFELRKGFESVDPMPYLTP
ncbi:LysM peptidoglycan-binding domain-containing M23 family metallopeptidase [Rhodovulum visakhapatnamense]|uniref:Murein DD-endopeptidase MepM/ murein hydrolase activator NlpD n=1 Tax=Rhodovulum visakhapatnamense TaxID=364297 RepID=A0A4R8GAU2_9RHOB|nr:LysM peptidoglycan-binding domain-containing M23 family metallopeptidase [Rhodovulum visakhapatnamense]TDX33688.1 murein DD-endopeptidase MepM/ murein hydrolase activator NlpD [Rhodovulum visakhapatnamense]